MDPVERIVKDYRNAGEEHRLDLFLAYRDLRDRFREIERENRRPVLYRIPRPRWVDDPGLCPQYLQSRRIQVSSRP